MSISNQYIDGSYIDKNPQFHVEDSPWKADQIIKMATLAKISPSSIAEIGCGAGEILVQLSKKLTSVEFLDGYELSPQAYELCKKRETEKIHYFNDDAFKGEKKNYDLVLCIDVFEHIENPFEFLRNLKKLGKKFIFHIPLDMNTQMVLRAEPIMRVRKDVGHLNYYSSDSAIATLKDCGYIIDHWFFTPNGADNPKSTKAKMLQLPRKILFKFFPELTVRILGGYSLMVCAS